MSSPSLRAAAMASVSATTQTRRSARALRRRGGPRGIVSPLAAGCGDGCGLGDNSKAALVTRALAEMLRLGTAMGGDPQTFYGLSGAGDLIATCFSPPSR